MQRQERQKSKEMTVRSAQKSTQKAVLIHPSDPVDKPKYETFNIQDIYSGKTNKQIFRDANSVSKIMLKFQGQRTSHTHVKSNIVFIIIIVGWTCAASTDENTFVNI